MRAIYLESYGKPESVIIGHRPTPQPAPGEVRVQIKCAAFNRVDLYMRAGGIGVTHRLPLILGVDGAGVVDALGAGVDTLNQGDRVSIYPARYSEFSEFSRRGDQMLCTQCRVIGEHIDGTFADYVCIPATNAFPISEAVPFEQAAALPTAYLTAWRMVTTRAQVSATDTVLIHGVGGGASCAAMQTAKLAGARVIVTSSNDSKLEKAKALGADAGINYRNEDVLKRVRALTDGRGVDVVIENIGEATWSTSLKSLVRGGRMVLCGATTGPNPPADLQRIFVRQLSIFGSTLGNHEEFRTLLLAAEQRQLVPVIDQVYPFERVHDALQRLDKGEQFGKLVLRVS